MAKKRDTTAKDVPQDTSAHAAPYNVGTKEEIGKGGDRFIVPEIGVFLTKHAVHDYERDASQLQNGNPYGSHDLYHQMLIPAETILEWAQKINKKKIMDEHAQRKTKHESNKYDGSDTIRGETKPTSTKNNQFWLDTSESRVLITVSHGTKWLNGSPVAHSQCVHIQLLTPDGRNYGSLSMSMDQFASALVSSAYVPCTWDAYWSLEDDCVLMQEVVKQPDPVDGRMKERLAHNFEQVSELVDEISAKLDAKIEAGKAMSKTDLANIRSELMRVKTGLHANTQFAVKQAIEEISAVVESAAISVATDHNLSLRQVADHAPLGTLLQTLINQKNLPAPDDGTSGQDRDSYSDEQDRDNYEPSS